MITKDKVVAIRYKLTDKDGKTIDESSEEPLEYIHGHHNLIPGLEKELEGHKIGDKLDVVIPAKEAYGEYDEEKVFDVERKLMGQGVPQVGMMARLMTDEGPMIATIVEVNDDTVKFDANHELAGQDLHFEVEVISIRLGTPEEIEAGRLHRGCGGDCSGCGGGCH